MSHPPTRDRRDGQGAEARRNVAIGTNYSAAFKAKVLQRMLSPNAPAMLTLSRELGVPEGTLYRWRNAATLGAVPKRHDDRGSSPTPPPSSERTAEQKLALVLEAAAIPDAELGEFLRRKGIHAAQLREWREQALAGLGGKPQRKAAADDARRLRELERELKRKDKALAETAALLVLKKKAQAIWGDEDDSTDPKSDE